MRLGLERVGILFAVSLLSTLLFSGAELLTSVIATGGDVDPSRSIQSIENFRTCTIQTTIGEWILLCFL